MRRLVHGHHLRQHGSRQADMVLELTPDSRAGGRGNMRGEGKVERGREEER